MDNQPIPPNHAIYLWAHNAIPDEIITFIRSHVRTKKQTDTILWYFLDSFMKNIRKCVWLDRCRLVKTWEASRGITRKKRRSYTLRKKRISTNPRHKHNLTHPILAIDLTLLPQRISTGRHYSDLHLMTNQENVNLMRHNRSLTDHI
jgi:hypothetical protein